MTTERDDGEPKLEVVGFWHWLIRRDQRGHRGLHNVFNRWLVFHVVAASSLALLGTLPAADIAKSVALPGAAILVGLAFGWAGRSASLMQDKTFSTFLLEYGQPAEGYVYSFQLAILAVLSFVGIALVMLAGGLHVSLGRPEWNAIGNRTLLFFTGSVAVRESWGIIYFVNKLTIQYYRVRELEDRK